MLPEQSPERFSPYHARKAFFDDPQELPESAVTAGISEQEAHFDDTAPEAILTHLPDGEELITIRDAATYRRLLTAEVKPNDIRSLTQRELMPVGSTAPRPADPRPPAESQLQESLTRLKKRFSRTDPSSISSEPQRPDIRLVWSDGQSLPPKESPKDSHLPEEQDELLEELNQFFKREELETESPTTRIVPVSESSTKDKIISESKYVRKRVGQRIRRTAQIIRNVPKALNKRKYMFEFGYCYEEPGRSLKFHQALRSPVISDIDTYHTKVNTSRNAEDTPIETAHGEGSIEASIELLDFNIPRKTDHMRNWIRKKTVQASTFINNTAEKARQHPAAAIAVVGGVAVAAAVVSYKFGVASGRSASSTEAANNAVNFTPASAPKTVDKGTEFYNWFTQYHPDVSRARFETIINSQEFKTLCENSLPA